MIDWAYVAVPFLVLPIVLLFRFVGCGNFTGSDASSPTGTGGSTTMGPPNYRDYLMGATPNPGTLKDASPVSPNDIIAYWRLVNQPSSGLAADEKNIHHGSYVQVAGGILITGQPSLVNATPTDKKDTCSNFQGGYVIVPYKDGLYDGFAAGNFTIECWINPQWNQTTPKGRRTLFYAGGNYQSPSELAPQFNAIRIYADESNYWQVDVYPNAVPGRAQLPSVLDQRNPVLVAFGASTHLVVTLQKNALALIDVHLWINGVNIASSSSTDSLLDCAAPIGAPFLIGVTNNSTVDPQSAAATVIPTLPIFSQIQEVVLYRRALSGPEIATHYHLNCPTGGY